MQCLGAKKISGPPLHTAPRRGLAGRPSSAPAPWPWDLGLGLHEDALVQPVRAHGFREQHGEAETLVTSARNRKGLAFHRADCTGKKGATYWKLMGNIGLSFHFIKMTIFQI